MQSVQLLLCTSTFHAQAKSNFQTVSEVPACSQRILGDTGSLILAVQMYFVLVEIIIIVMKNVDQITKLCGDGEQFFLHHLYHLDTTLNNQNHYKSKS